MSLSDDLRADGEPEVEFHQGAAARMPRKRIAAGAMIRDQAGRILMVEPLYKPTWDIPGGIVEADESPLEGCRREIREELGLDLPLSRLLLIDWVPRQGVWHDALLFVFDGGTLTEHQAAIITFPRDELTGVRFVTLDQAADHVRPSALRRIQVAIDVLSTPAVAPLYLHFGRPVLPNAR